MANCTEKLSKKYEYYMFNYKIIFGGYLDVFIL